MSLSKSESISIYTTPEITGVRANSLSSWLYKASDYIILILVALVSVFAWRYYYDQNLILSYNDAMSHLDISRRVVEGLKPGLAQIGSVWLPLPHLLQLIFIWDDFLWHSGLAGAIFSSLAFVGSTYLLFKLVMRLTGDLVAGFSAALIFMLNPNMSYMQAVPMTESLLIFTFIAANYSLLLWQKSGNFRYLILAGILTFLSTLTRYDGWMFLVQECLVIVIVSLRQGGWRRMESNAFLFGSIAFYGIILWLLWNLLIFGDPLYFATGPFSAKAQQEVFEAEGRLFSKGNLIYSIYIYSLAVIKNNGMIMSAIGLIGLAAYFVRKKFNSDALVVSLLVSPLIFNVLALFLGHSIINLSEIPPYTLFNVRYGLMMLPAIAFFVAYLSKKQRLLQIIILAVLAFQIFQTYSNDTAITVKDGIYGASAQGMTETGHWLGKNAKNGLILIAASSQDSLIFQSGLPMDRFIHEGTGPFWKESLSDPHTHAEWIAIHKGDLVYREIANRPEFMNFYERVYDGEFTDIYKYNQYLEKPLTAEDLP